MLTKLHTIKISIFLLLILIATAACNMDVTGHPPTPTPTVSVEDAVALTVAASAAEVPTLSVDEIVALTVAASAPADTVAPAAADAAPAAADTVAPAAPDTTAITSTVAQPAAVANQPQLRANQSANVRKGPGTSFDIASSLQLNAVANVVAKNRDESWYLIDIPGSSNKGWIANSVTDPVFPEVMGTVPVAATIPSPPTSTPTATATATTAATSTATATGTSGGHSPTHTPTPHGHTSTPTHTPTAEYIPVDVPVTVINDGSTPVCSLYIDLSAEPWGDDRLGGFPLYQGEQITFYFPSGEYDFAAYDCNNDAIMSQFNVLIISGYTWTITGF